MKQKQLEGNQGEEIASNYLKKLGYKIVVRNFKIRYGEIDIIALYNNTTVFIEVKTRSSSEFGTPLEAITPWKLKSVIKTAEFFMLANPKVPQQMRIDAVSVELKQDGSVGKIEHVKNISM